jgi:hypothetical protein
MPVPALPGPHLIVVLADLPFRLLRRGKFIGMPIGEQLGGREGGHGLRALHRRQVRVPPLRQRPA